MKILIKLLQYSNERNDIEYTSKKINLSIKKTKDIYKLLINKFDILNESY